jgi:hypothetical protein
MLFLVLSVWCLKCLLYLDNHLFFKTWEIFYCFIEFLMPLACISSFMFIIHSFYILMVSQRSSMFWLYFSYSFLYICLTSDCSTWPLSLYILSLSRSSVLEEMGMPGKKYKTHNVLCRPKPKSINNCWFQPRWLLVRLGFELMVLCLQSRCISTWATPPPGDL